MKLSPLFLTGIAVAATLNVSAMPSLSQSDSDQITFVCKQVFDSASGNKIPATLAWIPERQAHIIIIGWKSEYFPRWNPEKRCQTATTKFQTAYNEGRLNYLTTGENNNYPIICAVTKEGEQCDGKNQLFTIKHHDNPQLVLTQLVGNLQGNGGVIYQSSGKQNYFSFNEILQKAPTVPQSAISSK